MIGDRIPDLEPVRHLRHAIAGHGELVATIANHVEADHARRAAAREGEARGGILRGQMGDPT